MKDTISDEEFNFMFRADLENQLKEAILRTDIGKKVADFQQIPLKEFSMESLVDSCKESEKYSFSKNGVLEVDEKELLVILSPSIKQANERLMCNDILKTPIPEVRERDKWQKQFAGDYKEIIDAEGNIDEKKAEVKLSEFLQEDFPKKIEQSIFNDLTEINIFNDNLNVDEVFKDGFIKTNDLVNVLDSINPPIFSSEKNAKFAQKLENIDINTFIDTRDEFTTVQEIFQIMCLDKEKANLDYIRNSPDNKFKEYIKDKNGNITYESIREFGEKYIKLRNDADLAEDTLECLGYSKRDIIKNNDIEKQEKILVTLLRATKSDVPHTKEIAKDVAKKFNLDVFNEETHELDENKIRALAEEKLPDKIDLLVADSEWAEYNIFFKLCEIGQEIQTRQDEGKSTTRDDVLKRKAEARAKNKRVCSKKEQIIYDALNSHDTGYVGGSYFDKRENIDAILALYCKFRSDEEFSGTSLTAEMLERTHKNSNSSIILKYMNEHKEYFSDFLDENGNLNGEAVKKEMLENGNFRDDNYLLDYKSIKSKTSKVLDDEKKYGAQINALERKIRKVLNGKGENINIEQIFSDAQEIPIDILSTDILENLKNVNEEKFEEVFGKMAEKEISKNSKSATLTSFAREIRKKLVRTTLGQIIDSKKNRFEFEQGNNESENEEKDNKLKKETIFDKIRRAFYKPKTEETKESSTEQSDKTNEEDKEQPQNEQKYGENGEKSAFSSITVDVKKAVEQTSNKPKDTSSQNHDEMIM